MSSESEINDYIDEREPKADGIACECGGPVLTAEKSFSSETEDYQVIWEDEHDLPEEYAVYGWIKQANKVEGSDE